MIAGVDTAPGRSLALASMLLVAGCSDVVVGLYDGDGGNDASGGGGSSTGTEAGGFVGPGCFSDDFEDGVLDDSLWYTWTEEDSMLVETSGRLQLTPPSYGLFDAGIVGHFDYRFAFDDGWVRMRIGEPPAADLPVTLYLIVGQDPATVAMNIGEGEVRVSASNNQIPVQEQSFPMQPYPQWLGIRTDGPMAHFEVSDDGVSWTHLASFDKPGDFSEVAALAMAQTYGDEPTQAVVSIDTMEVCLQ